MDKGLKERSESANAQLVLARERGDEVHVVVAIGDEDGVDEHRLRS